MTNEKGGTEKNMDIATLVVVVLVIAVALTFDFTNGFHDTANAMATSIATGALKPKTAVIAAGTLNLIGAFLSTEVAKTISGGIINEQQVTIGAEFIFAGLVGAILWNLMTWLVGLPSSSSHALFGGLEGRMSMALFGVPAVKGVEFGNGFDCATLRGSQNNDPFVIENGKIKTLTNNAGGILGGITTGMPLIFKVAIKPTPSIGKPQQSVSLSRMENSELVIKGRHDPCIVPRAVPVIEAAAALALRARAEGRL